MPSALKAGPSTHGISRRNSDRTPIRFFIDAVGFPRSDKAEGQCALLGSARISQRLLARLHLTRAPRDSLTPLHTGRVVVFLRQPVIGTGQRG
jgi:hypothetical protein